MTAPFVPMTAAQATQCEQQIVAHLESARRLVYEFYTRQGWAALGYDSWRAWAQARLAQSQSHVYRLLNAAFIEQTLTGQISGALPESHTRALTPYKDDPAALATAMQIAERLAERGGTAVQARHVRSAVAMLTHADAAAGTGTLPASGLDPRTALHQSVADGGTIEWYTPAPIIAAARQALGTIDLDPASCDRANQQVGATKIYTAAEDGLHQPWHGRLWFNFPYDRHLDRWVAKLAAESSAGRVTAWCGITYAVPDRGWYQQLETLADAVCLLRQRVRFLDQHGVAQGSPVAPNAVFYGGPHVSAFAVAFQSFGRVLRLTPAAPAAPALDRIEDVIMALTALCRQTTDPVRQQALRACLTILTAATTQEEPS